MHVLVLKHDGRAAANDDSRTGLNGSTACIPFCGAGRDDVEAAERGYGGGDAEVVQGRCGVNPEQADGDDVKRMGVGGNDTVHSNDRGAERSGETWGTKRVS